MANNNDNVSYLGSVNPATVSTVAGDPNNKHVVSAALKHVVKDRLFPGQKFLHPDELLFSDNKNALVHVVRSWVNGPIASTQAWWARAGPQVASFLTKQRNTKCTAVKMNFMSKYLIMCCSLFDT